MSYSEREIQEFNNMYLEKFKNLRDLELSKKAIDKELKNGKEKLLKLMQEYGINSIENDYVKVSVTKASSSKSIDLKLFQDKEPVAYAELLEDYTKVTTRNESLRVVVK